jgi:hypothetical protein
VGAFFTNLQVRSASPRAVADAIREGVARDFEEVEEGADREVLVLPADAGGWVAVYDQRAESQEGKVLDALAGLVSRGTMAFGVTVHDSDVLFLTLYVDGAVADRYDSNPAYFGERPRKTKASDLAGHPDRWKRALAPGKTEDELRDTWKREDLFAEATLARTAELLACDPQRASVGHQYVDRATLPEGTIALRLRARVRPAYERLAEGPPRLEYPFTDPVPMQLAVGDELRLTMSTQSVGGPSTGLTFVAQGDALERGLVALERIELLVGDPRAGARHTMHPIAAEGAGDRRSWCVRLPDVALPAGPMGLERGFIPGMDVLEMVAARRRALVHANLVGRVLSPGHGAIRATFEPLADPAGSATMNWALTLDAPLQRPLRARGDLDTMPGGSSHLLRPLVGDAILVAMVAIDTSREKAAAVARDMLERTLAIAGAKGKVTTSVFRRDPGKRPSTKESEVSIALRGKRLDALARSFADESLVELKVREGPAFDPELGPVPARWGLTFGASILGDREEERVSTLDVWAHVDGLGKSGLGALRQQWIEVVDHAMHHGGVQGVVLRSGWSPQMGSTAYETAAGAPHGVQTARAWVTRWVRVPGNDRLWLSPALAAHVDPKALEAIADVDEREGVLAVALRDPASWRALEEALAKLLPTSEEGDAFRRKWHAPR